MMCCHIHFLKTNRIDFEYVVHKSVRSIYRTVQKLITVKACLPLAGVQRRFCADFLEEFSDFAVSQNSEKQETFS